MRIPARPPTVDLSTRLALPEAEEFLRRARTVWAGATGDRYLPWDELRNRRPPDGLTSEEWWLALKVARTSMQRLLPLQDTDGRPFTYALPDSALRGIEMVSKHTSGRISAPAPVLPDAPTRDRYVISSLIEEAITSSQLEGAVTTRLVAKEMLRSGRKPRTKDELMIVNNYQGMLRVREMRNESLSPALICEFHSILTEGTLEESDRCGRPQLPGENRVVITDSYGQVFHVPPPADELPARLERLCDFANASSDTPYIPPVVRAVLTHFMLAYDHPFVDGNGRTARLLFYWSMLNQDYWLAEFLPISRLLKKAPAQYARSFLYSEQDDGDLTYFVLYQLKVIERAITDLHEYLARKVAEDQQLRKSLRSMSGTFNHRQLALLEHALKNSAASYTVVSHGTSHNIAAETARTDLRGLEQRGFLTKTTSGRGHAWEPVPDLGKLLDQATHTAKEVKQSPWKAPTPLQER
jgi:Fic family protein